MGQPRATMWGQGYITIAVPKRVGFITQCGQLGDEWYDGRTNYTCCSGYQYIPTNQSKHTITNYATSGFSSGWYWMIKNENLNRNQTYTFNDKIKSSLYTKRTTTSSHYPYVSSGVKGVMLQCKIPYDTVIDGTKSCLYGTNEGWHIESFDVTEEQ